MAKSSCFQVNFDLDNYKKIFPELPQSQEIINYNASSIDECIWTPQTMDNLGKKFDLSLEAKRLKQGTWIRIKDEILWIPPNYYNFLNYGIAFKGEKPEFRLQQLKLYYEKLIARLNPYIIGTLLMKIRQSGITTVSCNDALYEMQDGVNSIGNVNIQSKTGADARNVNWSTLIGLWNNYPSYIKQLMYSDFSSGKFVSEQLKFQREREGVSAVRNLRVKWYNSTHDAQDGSTNVLLCILDEICKWVECDFSLTYGVCKKFIEVGSMRVGMFDMYSSPSPINNKSNEQVFELWKNSNPKDVDDFGSTKSGIHRLVLSPLEGILGEYDKYGDVDPNKCYEKIMRMRKSATTAEAELAEIRANPLTEDEMFSSFDNDSNWDNHKGIAERKIYLVGTRYKNEEKLEPKYIVGNLEWENGIRDTRVIFKPYDGMEFDLAQGRFKFTELPEFENELKSIFYPPEKMGQTVNGVIGVDSFKKVEGGTSKGAGIYYKYKDHLNPNYIAKVAAIYLNRPHREVFFEDMLKFAIFTRSKLQIENIDDEIIEYIIQRGYENWLIESIGTIRSKRKFGDGAKGRGATAFLNEGIDLINWYLNTRVNPEEPYHLEHLWFEELIDDVLKCNLHDPTSRKKSDLTMALLQALLGAAKLQSKKVRRGVKGLGAGILSTLY